MLRPMPRDAPVTMATLPLRVGNLVCGFGGEGMTVPSSLRNVIEVDGAHESPNGLGVQENRQYGRFTIPM